MDRVMFGGAEVNDNVVLFDAVGEMKDKLMTFSVIKSNAISFRVILAKNMKCYSP